MCQKNTEVSLSTGQLLDIRPTIVSTITLSTMLLIILSLESLDVSLRSVTLKLMKRSLPTTDMVTLLDHGIRMNLKSGMSQNASSERKGVDPNCKILKLINNTFSVLKNISCF